jgi:hypothetical protein
MLPGAGHNAKPLDLLFRATGYTPAHVKRVP